jgi:acyl-CoA thioesterase
MDVRSFLGLEPTGDPTRWRLPISHGVTGGRGALYGGCGLAAVVETAEAATGLPVTWAACQFVRGATEPQVLELRFDTLAAGRRITQGQVTATVDDPESGPVVVLAALVALGRREFPLAGQWGPPPPLADLPPPDRCPPRALRPERVGGLRPRIDERIASGPGDGTMTACDGRSYLWATFPGGVPAAAGAIAVVGDGVSAGAAAAVGEDLRVRSIDNTIRVVQLRPCDWVLVDTQVDGAADGLACGTCRLWTPDGHLLAVTSQSGLVGHR